ncbi:MAG: cysteine desulfurase NifS [Clostridiales bacterium]|nr:cysteine desulfurase NifS [Clostridiales bacterium]
MKRIYLDNAATTACAPEVVEAMLPYFTEVFGNASSIHAYGREAKRAIEAARRQVARALNAAIPQEIIFTAGGSESDNWAIKGAAFSRKEKGRHIITTAIEHHAVLHTCQWLEKQCGFEVTYLPVDADGKVSAAAVEKAIRPDTVLVSVMAANNEIGTLQPIAEIGTVCRARGVLFHTDAVQAVGAIPLDVQAMNIDLLSLSGHKFHGPKGVGALYVRKGLKLDNLIHGGAQERGFRAGTENLPGIVGMGRAIELAAERLTENAQRMIRLRDRLITGIMERVPEVRLNGHPTDRLPNNCNLSFKYIEGEALLLRLDLAGIAGSSGSACTSGTLDPSHVLLAIGLPHAIAHGSLRLTLGADTTDEDIDAVLDRLPPIVQDLRAMSAMNASNML